MKESKQIIINIKQLVGILKNGETKICGEEMNNIYTIENAFLEITDNLI